MLHKELIEEYSNIDMIKKKYSEDEIYLELVYQQAIERMQQLIAFDILLAYQNSDPLFYNLT